jgi:3-methyladenine DNA glycosylase/8-oxoguanine DNA glycosylase
VRYGPTVIETSFAVRAPFDLDATMRAAGVATSDGAGSWWWATRHGDATATIAVSRSQGGVTVTAWGDAAEPLVDRVPRLLGLEGDLDGIDAQGPAAPHLRAVRGMRLGATGDVHGALVTAVLGQMVTTVEARASLAALTRRLGEAAPGPVPGLRIVPSPRVLSVMSYDEFHRFGIERKRASVLVEVARRAPRLAEIVAMDRDASSRRLMAVRGVGAWTAAHVMGVAWGDADAVPPGDYHLPHMVAWALAGEDRGSDARMFELLEPYRPHRRRVIVALKLAGVHAPRFGPRTPVRTHL